MQIDVGKARAVLARMERSTGADRELDRDILLATIHERRLLRTADDGHNGFWFAPDGDNIGDETPRLTASIDAADALRRRVLPESWRKSAARRGNACSWCEIGADDCVGFSDAPTEPLAILIALFRAIVAREEGR